VSEQLHPDFDPDFDHVVRLKDAPAPIEEELPFKPYQIAAQLKMFKNGLMGEAVTMWSRAKGNPAWDKTQLFIDATTPWVCSWTEPNLEQDVLFAAGYVYGWHESRGGQPQDLEIWLETHVE
jgi:hypothetical protein